MSKPPIIALGIAYLVILPWPTIGEEAPDPTPLYVEIDVRGEIQPETRQALARLFGRSTGAELRHLALEHGTVAGSLCGRGIGGGDRSGCLRQIRSTVARTNEISAPFENLETVPIYTLGDDSYALLNRRAVLDRRGSVTDWSSDRLAVDWPSEGAGCPSWSTEPGDCGGPGALDILAVPLDDSFFVDMEVVEIEPSSNLPLDDPDDVTVASVYTLEAYDSDSLNLFPSFLAYDPIPDDEVALIDRDFAALGYSSREFRTDLDPEEARELLTVVAADPAVQVGATGSEPRQGFEFIHPQSVTFEAATGDCALPNEEWPLPTSRIMTTMCFNERVREQLGLGPLRRSRILVVDSGLGTKLAHHTAFHRGLYIEPSEFLTPGTMLQDSLENPKCVDADDNEYFSDVYGAGPQPSDRSTECRVPSFVLDQLAPIEQPPLSKQEYFPGHGGFVAGLALGGGALLERFPGITAYVGVSFFRVTRGDGHGHVKTESSDIAAALLYADRIRADVVNLSLRTHKEEPFKNLDPDLFLVTSAGNEPIDLDQPSPENLPASMEDLAGQLLVVGAVQDEADDPWWSDSAHSTTKVHLAAPGVDIWSFGPDGNSACASGTSAAAPLVSFTAATLRALGLPHRRSIRARILASSDHLYGLLDHKVAEGRRLNVEAALDVFVDRIEIKLEDGSSQTLRGWIVPTTRSVLRICGHAAESADLRRMKGHIDLSRLWAWRRHPSKGGRFFHSTGSRGQYRADDCSPPDGTLRIRLLSGKEIQPSWSQVLSILPSPFRAAEEGVLEMSTHLLVNDPDPENFAWCAIPDIG